MGFANLLMNDNDVERNVNIPQWVVSEQPNDCDEKLQEDLDDFLDDSMESTYNNVEEISAEYANYLIYRYKRNVDKQDSYKEYAKKIAEDYKDRVMAWAEKRASVLDSDNERCLSILNEYFKRNAKKESEKIKLPEGTIGYYKKARSVKIDSAELVKYYEDLENGAEKETLAQYLKPKIAFDTTKLKSACVVDDATSSLLLNGSPLPGATIIPASVDFKVRK